MYQQRLHIISGRGRTAKTTGHVVEFGINTVIITTNTTTSSTTTTTISTIITINIK